jgi:hypothetical protein
MNFGGAKMNELMDLCVCDAENKLYENNLLINDGTVKFLADKCAVVEYYRNNKYLYYAININTLETKYLGLRKNEIDPIYYYDLLKKVINLEINKNDLTLKLTRYEREKALLSHIFIYTATRRLRFTRKST